jgi:hypothetical protein
VEQLRQSLTGFLLGELAIAVRLFAQRGEINRIFLGHCLALIETRARVTAHYGNAPRAREGITADPRGHLEDGLAEMKAMAFDRCRDLAPTRDLAELPGFGLFDPLGEM